MLLGGLGRSLAQPLLFVNGYKIKKYISLLMTCSVYSQTIYLNYLLKMHLVGEMNNEHRYTVKTSFFPPDQTKSYQLCPARGSFLVYLHVAV